jgi:hypothetical protein
MDTLKTVIKDQAGYNWIIELDKQSWEISFSSDYVLNIDNIVYAGIPPDIMLLAKDWVFNSITKRNCD